MCTELPALIFLGVSLDNFLKKHKVVDSGVFNI